jgi:hypothetical protein
VAETTTASTTNGGDATRSGYAPTPNCSGAAKADGRRPYALTPTASDDKT